MTTPTLTPEQDWAITRILVDVQCRAIGSLTALYRIKVVLGVPCD